MGVTNVSVSKCTGANSKFTIFKSAKTLTETKLVASGLFFYVSVSRVVASFVLLFRHVSR